MLNGRWDESMFLMLKLLCFESWVLRSAPGSVGAPRGFLVHEHHASSPSLFSTAVTLWGSGCSSTFAVSNNTVVSSQSISAVQAVETKFYARSTGLPGEVVKISSISNAGGSN